MSSTPILTAIEIMRRSVYMALSPLHAATYWQQATQGVPLPFVVYQSQDLGGTAEKWFNIHGWSGLVTVRALAESQSAAETLFNTVAPGMNSLQLIGYSIGAEFERPIVVPPVNGVWQTGGVWRVTID